jgi:aminoglycoside phosphotransferase (APT) family kinase protein
VSTRPRWARLPATLRASIEDRLGAATQRSDDQDGGFTHGLATRLLLADGTRVFVKGIPADDPLARAYVDEAWYAARLPPRVPAPRFRFSLLTGGWLVLAFDDVAGRSPDLTQPGDRRTVLATVERLAAILTPTPMPEAPPAAEALAPVLHGWRTFASQSPPDDLDTWSLGNLNRLAALESRWPHVVGGQTLLHADLRPDNMVMSDSGRLHVVDWSSVCVGAPWVDLIVLLASVDGLDPEAVVRDHPVTRAVDPAAIDALVCGLLGCWEQQSREPHLPTSPNLRQFQARNAKVTRDWLIRRTGWQ